MPNKRTRNSMSTHIVQCWVLLVCCCCSVVAAPPPGERVAPLDQCRKLQDVHGRRRLAAGPGGEENKFYEHYHANEQPIPVRECRFDLRQTLHSDEIDMIKQLDSRGYTLCGGCDDHPDQPCDFLIVCEPYSVCINGTPTDINHHERYYGCCHGNEPYCRTEIIHDHVTKVCSGLLCNMGGMAQIQYIKEALHPKAVNGGWTQWTDDGSCSVTCGDGFTLRSRSCTNPVPQNGGTVCAGLDKGAKSCSIGPCNIAVNGGWTQWTKTSQCSVTCGDGVRNRSRSCSNPTPQYGGTDCVGNKSELVHCTDGPCYTAVNGGWTQWTDISQCSKTCGDGVRFRSRSCSNPTPQNGGTDCVGLGTEFVTCSDGSCQVTVNGGWTTWANTSQCSVTCGDGVGFRSRSCSNPTPQNGGTDCVGKSSEFVPCTDGPCHIAVNGGWTQWTNTSQCSVTCGDGVRFRSRSCSNPTAQYGGTDCVDKSSELVSCTDGACHIAVNGGWTQWTNTLQCSVTCGDGVRNRSRSCSNPTSQYGGTDCVGKLSELVPCTDGPCQLTVNGGWTQWTDKSQCSVTCGDGVRFRSRSCSNPTPQYGGTDCVGNVSGFGPCTDGVCQNQTIPIQIG